MKQKTKDKKKPFFTMRKLVVLFVLCVLILCGLWAVLKTVIVKGVNTSLTNLRSQGYQVEHDGLSVKGFPLKIKASSGKVSIIAPSSAQLEQGKNWSVTTSNLNLTSATLTPLSWDLGHKGPMRIKLRANNNVTYLFDIIPAAIDAHIAVSFGGHLKTAHLDMKASRFDTLMGVGFPVLSLGDIQANLDVKGSDGFLHVQGKDIVLSDAAVAKAKRVLGNTLSSAETTMTISNWNTLERQGQQVWMNAGGRLKSEHWLIKWGAVDIVGSFNIHYKDQKPEGVVRLRIKDVNGLMEKMVQAGWINGQQSKQAGLLLGALETDNDNRKTIPLTLKDGKLKYGFITLTEF